MIPLGIGTFALVKFFHILIAIIAVGFNASYAIWISHASKEPEHELFTLKGIKVLDDRYANPGYALLLLTGLWMVRLGPWSILHDFWLGTALGIYVATALVAILVYTPTLRKQIALLEAGQGRTPDYKRVAQRGTFVGMLLGVFVIAIVFLMVTKPTL
jgi:uncharacterized membrane protein